MRPATPTAVNTSANPVFASTITTHPPPRLLAEPPRLEQFLFPPRWVVAIRFDTIEHNGVEKALDLRPMDDGNRARRNTILTEKRPPGAGVFIFPQRGNLVLDRKFHSEWETR